MNMSRCLGTNYRLRELHRNYLCICYNSATCGAIEECIYAHSTNLASTVSFCLSLFILHTQIPWIAACNINICSCNILKKANITKKKLTKKECFYSMFGTIIISFSFANAQQLSSTQNCSEFLVVRMGRHENFSNIWNSLC